MTSNRCDVCRRKVPKRPFLEEPERAYIHVAEGRRLLASEVCEACWQRHLRLDAAAKDRFRQENPFEEVCSRMRDGDQAARRKAARTLGALGDRRGIPVLSDALMPEVWGDRGLGIAIVDGLAMLGGPEAERALIAGLDCMEAWQTSRALDYDVPTPAEGAICGALMLMGGSKLWLQALIETMTSRTIEGEIRAKAARALYEITRLSVVGFELADYESRPLTSDDRAMMIGPLRSVRHDRDESVRSFANLALANLRA
ncbi:HEAT repeat domain-containing protein [Glycomyces sp. NPDC047369]